MPVPLLFILLFACVSAIANTKPIMVDKQDQSINVLNGMLWQVTDNNTSIVDIARAEPATWHQYQGHSDTTLAPAKTAWFKFTIQATSSSIADKVLLLRVDPREQAEVFMLDSNGQLHRSDSSNQATTLYASRLSAFPLRFYTNEPLTIYISYSNKRANPMFANLVSPKKIAVSQQQQQTLVTLYIGAFGVLIILYLVTYLRFHDPMRFWFSILLTSYLLLLLNLKNITQIPEFIAINYQQITLWLTLLLVLSTHKLLSHLQINAGHWKLKRMLIATAVMAVAVFFIPIDSIPPFTVLYVAGYVCVLLYQATFWQSLLSTRATRYLLLGWGCMALFNLVHIVFDQYLVSFELIWHALSLVIITLGIVLQVLGIELFDRRSNELRQQQQEQRKEQLNYFFQLFKSSAEGLYTASLDGKIETINPAMCQLFGYQSETQFFNEIKNTSSLYADSTVRSRLIQQLKQDGAILGKEICGLRRDGSQFWFSLSVQIQVADNREFLYGSVFDISEKIENNQRQQYIDDHDTMTGHLNRKAFERCINNQLKRDSSPNISILYIDVDHFKVFNDAWGHKAGDTLLCQIASTISKIVANQGTLARIAGDEFALLLNHDQRPLVHAMARELLNGISSNSFLWHNTTFIPTVSIGIYHYQDDVHYAGNMISMAESACYLAKERGRNQYYQYSRKNCTAEHEEQLRWLNRLHRALENQQFTLYFQPIENLSQPTKGFHYELLLRLVETDGNVLVAGKFIDVAEKFNLMGAIDRWVISDYAKWLNNHPQHQQALYQCNINVSSGSLADDSFEEFVIETFKRYHIPLTAICFEITEGQAIFEDSSTLASIRSLQQHGCKFALDDFGKGFSSYAHLHKLPVNYLKIDGQFIRNLSHNKIDQAMVKSIQQIATAMDIHCIAEFVENDAIVTQLQQLKVTYGQGFHFSTPKPLHQLITEQ